MNDGKHCPKWKDLSGPGKLVVICFWLLVFLSLGQLFK